MPVFSQAFSGLIYITLKVRKPSYFIKISLKTWILKYLDEVGVDRLVVVGVDALEDVDTDDDVEIELDVDTLEKIAEDYYFIFLRFSSVIKKKDRFQSTFYLGAFDKALITPPPPVS